MSLSNIKVNNLSVLGIDDKPISESNNIVKSNGIYKEFESINGYNSYETLSFSKTGYIDANTGELVTRTGFRATELISINSRYIVTYNCYHDTNNYVCAFYNYNQEFLKNLSIVGTGEPSEHTINVPVDAAYLRLSSYVDSSFDTPSGSTKI